MNYQELENWVKETQNPNEQVFVAIEEEEEFAEDYIPGLGLVFYLPFKAHIHGPDGLFPGEYRLYANLWTPDEYYEQFNWGQVVEWISDLPDKNREVHLMVAYHRCSVESFKDLILYAKELIPKMS